MEFRLDSFRKIKMSHAWIFALLLFIMQLITGTILDYALLVMAFVIFTVAAVNSAGGPLTVSGFGIAMIGLKIVIISQWAKVFLNQPGNSYLNVPVQSVAILTTGMIAIWLAGFTIKPFIGKKKILEAETDSTILLGISIIVYVIGLTSYLYFLFHGYDPASGEITVGGISGILRSVGFIYPVSVIAAVAYTIQASNYNKSIGVWSAIPLITQFIFGVLGTSKQMMFEPFFLYLLTCLAYGFKFNKKHIISLLGAFLLIVVVLFPFAQIGRAFTRDKDPQQNITLTKIFVQEIFLKKENFEEVESFMEEAWFKDQRFMYYGKDLGFLDRVSLIEQNDELFMADNEQGSNGWPTIVHGFKMLPPRFLYSDKPIYNSANYFGHKIGILDSRDNTTQVSMGLIAEAYDAFGWIGVIVIPYVSMFLFIWLFNTISGSIERNIWTIFLIGIFQHNLVEATVSSLTLYLFQFPLIFFALYMIIKRSVKILLPVWQKISKRWPFYLNPSYITNEST